MGRIAGTNYKDSVQLNFKFHAYIFHEKNGKLK